MTNALAYERIFLVSDLLFFLSTSHVLHTPSLSSLSFHVFSPSPFAPFLFFLHISREPSRGGRGRKKKKAYLPCLKGVPKLLTNFIRTDHVFIRKLVPKGGEERRSYQNELMDSKMTPFSICFLIVPLAFFSAISLLMLLSQAIHRTSLPRGLAHLTLVTRSKI